MQNKVIQHAISMALITIGECAKHLSGKFKDEHYEKEWTKIIAVRNIAAHGYWQLNMTQIWKAIETDNPAISRIFR